PNHTPAPNYARVHPPGSDLGAASSQTDCPRVTQERTWVENGVMNQSAEVTTTYSAWSPNMAECDITPPTPADTTDSVVYKEFYATSGWQKGLTTSSEAWANGTKKRWTSVSWAQDDTTAGYTTNPRATDTTVNDLKNNGSSNHRRT